MAADLVAFSDRSADQVGVLGGPCTYHEKRSAGIVLGKYLQYLRRVLRIGAIIEGQGDTTRSGHVYGAVCGRQCRHLDAVQLATDLPATHVFQAADTGVGETRYGSGSARGHRHGCDEAGGLHHWFGAVTGSDDGDDIAPS